MMAAENDGAFARLSSIEVPEEGISVVKADSELSVIEENPISTSASDEDGAAKPLGVDHMLQTETEIDASVSDSGAAGTAESQTMEQDTQESATEQKS